MINYKELASRLAASIKEGPNSINNAKRIWEIWIQCLLFDEKDRMQMFSRFSGLPDGVVQSYMQVCRVYEKEHAKEIDTTVLARNPATF